MDSGEECPLAKDLEASVVGLPHGYQVLVGWDANINEDIGWITLKQGVSLDFSHLQLRDYNLNMLEKVGMKSFGQDVNKCSEDVCSEIKSSGTPCSELQDGRNQNLTDNNDNKRYRTDQNLVSKDIGESCIEGKCKDLVSQKVNDHAKEVTDKVIKEETVEDPANNKKCEYEDVYPKVICSYCNRRVSHLAVHETKCPSKKAKTTERVKCPMCEYRPIRASLTSHMRSHFVEKRPCPKCGLVVRQDGYDLHLERCRFRKRSSISCPVCKKSFDSIVLLSKHLEVEHPKLSASPVEPIVKSKNKNFITTKPEFTGKRIVESENVFDYPACKFKEASCQLSFEIGDGGKVMKKNIKTLMSGSVEMAMKKFCNSKKFSRQFGYKVEDLEFKSNDIVLSGEELAGSIDNGLIKVSCKSDEHEDLNPFDMTKDLISTDEFEEIKRDWLKIAPFLQHSKPIPDMWGDFGVSKEFPALGSVESVEVSEGTMDMDVEDMELDREEEVEVNTEQTEHVVNFSEF